MCTKPQSQQDEWFRDETRQQPNISFLLQLVFSKKQKALFDETQRGREPGVSLMEEPTSPLFSDNRD